jgi:hypothetical protein
MPAGLVLCKIADPITVDTLTAGGILISTT